MSIKDLKFNAADFSGKDISSLPDRPGDSGITGQQLKERFDQIPKIMVAMGGFNDLIDELNGANGAENIGVTPVEGLNGGNIQQIVNEVGGLIREATNAASAATVAATEASEAAATATAKANAAATAANNATSKATAAETAANTATAKADTAASQGAAAATAATAATAAANNAAAAANQATAAIQEVKSYADEKAQEAKDYVDNAILEGGAVTSVFGRAGEVKAQAGDYTAAMVGARSNTWMPNAAETGAAPSIHASQHLSNGADPIIPENIGAIPTNEKGAVNGVATLDDKGKLVQMPNSDDVGAVSKTGDTMTGSSLGINNGHGIIVASATATQLETRNTAGSNANRRILTMSNSDAQSDIAKAITIGDIIDGVAKSYILHGAHSKPNGSYTGNGSSTTRTINIGGISHQGNVLAISMNGYWGFAFYNGGFFYNTNDAKVYVLASSQVKFQNGVLTLATNNGNVNNSGSIYYYQVL